MTALKILYLGALGGTSLDRANAYRRLGHEVHQLAIRTLLPRSAWVDRATWRIGGEILTPLVQRGLAKFLNSRQFDICHVDSGEWVSPAVIALLRQHTQWVINYNVDDPLGPRDGRRFSAYRKALPHYDLVAVVREQNVAEAYAQGARKVLHIWRSADEVSHAPRDLSQGDHQQWDCAVLFLGTWMPERGPFLLDLVRRGVPLTIRGSLWCKAPEWDALKAYWKGEAIEGDSYAKAIQCAHINLGLLSKGNRDLHTQRSLEIPALGGLLCAERTKDHFAMYRENEEAVFWSDAEECATLCHELLQDPSRRDRLRKGGKQRFVANKTGNEDLCRALLSATATVSRDAPVPKGR